METQTEPVREYPFTIKVPVEDKLMAFRVPSLSNWLGIHAKGHWVQDVETTKGRSFAIYSFTSPWDAKAFEEWLGQSDK